MQKLFRPVLTLHPERLDITSAWIGHIPFAFWVIDAVKPDSLVELGTHGGVSYCAFCQAINHLKLDTSAHAVDTWQGDSHTGDYPSDTYRELKTYHDARYASFSDLVRSTFDNAVDKFADGSIDLLHIDGLHTLDAVRHDFESWLPKVSERGVILFHDINVYERDFGVQELWRELSAQYPSFTFHHGHGLGVLATGKNQSKQIEWLTSLSTANARLVRERFCAMAGPFQHQAELENRATGLQAELERIDAERNRLDAERQSALQTQNELAIAKREVDATALKLSERLQTAEAELHAQKLQIQDLSKTLAQQEASATAANERGNQLASDFNAVTTSTSWKLTRPIRWLGSQRRQLTTSTSAAGSLVRTLRAPGGVEKAVKAIRSRGLKGSLARLRSQVAAAKSLQHQLASGDDYPRWVARYDTLTSSDLTKIAEHTATFDHQSLLSIVLPVYDTEPEFLAACIDSVIAQTYSNWELCIADDASPSSATRDLLARYQRQDSRIRCVFRDTQGGIAQCTNSALEISQGEFVALLDHDDVLPKHALYMVANELNHTPELDILYSDEDKIDEHGVRHEPHFKSDFNYELLLGQNCFSHLGVYRASLVKTLGGIREGFDGSQDHDLALRMVAQTSPERIRHIPHVLYHWRVFKDSGSFSTDNLDKAVAAGVRAVSDHLSTTKGATVAPAGVGGFLRVDWPLPAELPSVSVIIPTRDNAQLLDNCTQGLLSNTNYSNLEIVVVDNGSIDPTALALMATLAEHPAVRVLRYDHEFNYSAINNFAVENTNSDYVCLLNDDIEIMDNNWLRQMIALAMRETTGAVGARLLYADNSIQHGGVVLGVMGVANHWHKDLNVDSPGYFGRLQLSQELSAVTAACLVIKRSIYVEVGGFNETQLAVAFNDVDFCLRVREAGYRNLWTPQATLYHLESASRGSDLEPKKALRFEKEVAYMQKRWADQLLNDSFYNANLTLDSVDMGLAFPPRAAKPWTTSPSRSPDA